jgi:hypothetical protein
MLAKEALGRVRMQGRVVVVPVDDDVDAVRDGRIDDGAQQRDVGVGCIQVGGVLGIVFGGLDAQWGAHDRDLPVGHQPVDDFAVPVLAHPLAPKQAHASKLQRLAAAVDDPSVGHP